MNPSHVAATGGVTAMIAQLLVWATHLPLQPLDANTALAVAGLLVSGAGSAALAWSQQRRARSAPVLPEQPEHGGSAAP